MKNLNLKKFFAVLAVMLCVCMVIPSTVYANELTPDSTPESTLSPDDSASDDSAPDEISADPTATPEVIASPEVIATPEAAASAEPEATSSPEAAPAETEMPESTQPVSPSVPVRRGAIANLSKMMSGADFNIAIKRLSGQTVSDGAAYTKNTTIKAFVVTRDAPPEGAATIDLNTFPTESGGHPLLAWFDSATGTVYCQSTTPRTFIDGDCTSMFQGMEALEKVDFYWTSVAPSSTKGMFFGCYKLTTLDVSNWDTSHVTDMSGMFCDCKVLTTLDVSGWDTGEVTGMGIMFRNCGKLTTLDVSRWNTSKVTTMGDMFNTCRSITTLDVSAWNTSRVTNMNSMFYYCDHLATMDVSKWDTSKVTGMGSMFSTCRSITTLDVSAWNTSQVTNMNSMFYYCDRLATIDVSKWDTGKVTDMGQMFISCSSLTTLDISGWNTSRVTNMYRMFYNCSSLTALDIAGWNTSQVKYMKDVLSGCSSLALIKAGPGFFNSAKIAFPTPSKTISGKVSSGKWGLDSETAEKEYTADELATMSQTAGALAGTWYAQEATAITIHFNANGGSGTMDAQILTAEGPLNTVKFSRAGYVFTGWNTAADGSGTAYANEAVFTPAGKDVTLYAQWETGVELPEAGYSGNPGYRVLGLAMTMFGLLMCIVLFSKEKEN